MATDSESSPKEATGSENSPKTTSSESNPKATDSENNPKAAPQQQPPSPTSPTRHRRSASFTQSSSSLASSAAAAAASARPPVIKDFSQSGWTFRSVRSSISSAAQVEAISHSVGFPLPTMFFGSNRIEITGPNGFSLHFDPVEAIRSVAKSSSSSESVPVRIAAARAEFWRKKNEEEQIFDYDWTYTPHCYFGNMQGHASISATAATINYARLKQQDSILFFDENILYEDELGDNGISVVLAKVRVMEYGFLILFKHFLRVDQILFKTASCRYYHEFGQGVVLRELRHCKDTFDAVVGRLLLTNSNFKDNDAVAQTLPIQSVTTEAIQLQ